MKFKTCTCAFEYRDDGNTYYSQQLATLVVLPLRCSELRHHSTLAVYTLHLHNTTTLRIPCSCSRISTRVGLSNMTPDTVLWVTLLCARACASTASTPSHPIPPHQPLLIDSFLSTPISAHNCIVVSSYIVSSAGESQ